MYYKLSDYAKKFNVTYKTAWNHYKSGKIDGAFLDERTNRVYIPVGSFNENKTKKVALYARVSNNDAKDNLDRQLERIRNYSISNGYNIIYEIKEISSGLNDKRTKLIKLLKKDDYDIIVVENKDRLTRFGFNYIKVLLNTKDKDILVINDNLDDKKRDLVDDLISIIYSFSARIYGLRKGREKGKEIKDLLILEKNDIL
jgi:putative resolvase